MNKFHRRAAASATPAHGRPVESAVRHALRSRQARAIGLALLGGSLTALPPPADAQAALEEVIVTAQKREENLQSVPISVQVLTGDQLSELNITTLDQYVALTPSVSFQTLGPGQSQIYMRGISDGGDGNLSGTTPSVALYLDEQPVTAIGRILNVHMYDIARVEALPGPQGTLFGANSQGGAIRIITNQPNREAFEAGYDLEVNTVDDGGTGYTAEGFVNVPFAERAALRLVGWYVEQGGWVDVVRGSQTFSRSGLTVENFGNADPKKNTVEEDYNPATNAGARAALGIDLTDSWTATLGVVYQDTEYEGLNSDQPGPGQVGEGKSVRFFQDDYNDTWTQTSLTITGDVGFADLTFAGSYLDREVEYDSDYTAYAEYSDYIEPYYTCVAYDLSNCTDPRIQFDQDSHYKRYTGELRLASTGERTAWVAGLFYTHDEHEYFNKWVIPTIPPENAIPTDRNIRGRTDLYFATNQIRTTSEIAAFGEFTYSFTDRLSGTVGMRWFQTQDDLEGFVGSRFSCYDPADGNRVGNGTPTSPNCGGGLDSEVDDSTYKLSLSYRFNEQVLTYLTYSEGFRPGGINREDSPVIPQVYQPDVIENFEFGWKSTLLDGTMRFNGAIYYMDWKDLQLTRFDPAVSLVGLTANTGGAEVYGVEVETMWRPSEAWTLAAAVSYNHGELKEDFFVSVGDPDPAAPEGTDLPFTPDLKYTLFGRYDFDVGTTDWYAQGTWTWTDSSWNDLFVDSRTKQGSYGFLNAAIGTTFGKSSVELYANNLTNEYAELLIYDRAGDNRVVTNPPLTVGLRFWQRF